MQPTVLLIGSEHFNWIGLRVTLQDRQSAHILGDVRDASMAVHEAHLLQPDVILVAADVTERPLLVLVRDLHLTCPVSKIIVLREIQTLDEEALRSLAPFVAGYLVWEGLPLEAVLHSLPVVVDGLVVGSRPVMETCLGMADRRSLREFEQALTPLQRNILQSLATGLTQREVARARHVSEATVERSIASLRAKFGVPTTCALCAQAGRLGFIG